MNKITTLFILLFSNILIAQTPCEDGMAGSYPCNGFDLMSNIPLSTLKNPTTGNPEGNDIWGWTDPTTKKEYAIMGLTSGTAFIDVTDPVNPVHLGFLPTQTSSNIWRDIKVYNNHAFIVADAVGNHGMQVFDLTRLRNVTNAPVRFTVDALYSNVGSCHNIVINESEGMAYLVGCNTFSGGPVFVDISDPKNPTSAGGYADKGYTHDAQVVTYNGPDTEHNGKQILIASNGTTQGTNNVVVLDVTNKNNVTFISEITYPNARYAHQGWFTDDMRYFILGDELDEQRNGGNTRTLVFNLSDLDNPSLSYTYNGTSPAIDHNGYVLGNKFYMASYRAGMRVLDISNISASTNAMSEISYFDTYPSSNSTAFNGAWSVYPYFESGNIIISDIESGLFVVRSSDNPLSNNTSEVSKYTMFPNPSSNELTIESTVNIKTISIYNTLGQVVKTVSDINSNSVKISTDQLASGIYTVKVNNLTSKQLIIN